MERYLLSCIGSRKLKSELHTEKQVLLWLAIRLDDLKTNEQFNIIGQIFSLAI